MKAILTFIIASVVFVFSNAQSKYETEMQKTFSEWDSAKTSEQLVQVSQHFERIANVEKANWIPKYYVILTKTLNAFSLEPKVAFEEVDNLLTKYDELTQLKDNSETLVLKGLLLTVKVAKDPMTYGQSLSPKIMEIYQKSVAIDNNPRAMYLLAQYKMGGAKFWGKDPKEYCSEVEKAIEILSSEKKENFEPSWGKKQAEEIKAKVCK